MTLTNLTGCGPECRECPNHTATDASFTYPYGDFFYTEKIFESECDLGHDCYNDCPERNQEQEKKNDQYI